MLNFVPEPNRVISEMTRVVKSGSSVAAYVWDYAGKMQLMRHFWNAAAALDRNAFDNPPTCKSGVRWQALSHLRDGHHQLSDAVDEEVCNVVDVKSSF
jgi:hypothetical protein